MDPYGYQLLHDKIQEWKSEDITMICEFSQVKDCIWKVMFNRSGSDLLKKLYKVCDEEQMTHLVSSVTDDLHLLMAVCLDSQGSKSMREFIGLMTTEQIVHIISFFTYIMVPLANDQFGSCVISRCLEKFPALAVETQPIVDVVGDNCLELAYDKNGSRLLQAILSKDTILRSSRGGRIILTIISNSYYLSRDEFGHKLILHVIGLEMPNQVIGIVDKLGGNFDILAMDEYGSTVVTKLMEASNGKYASEIIYEIITGPALPGVLGDTRGSLVMKSAQEMGILPRNLKKLIRRHCSAG